MLSALGSSSSAIFSPLFSLPAYVEQNFLSFRTLAVITLIVLILLYIRQIWMSYTYFDDLGLKTPRYRFMYGNLKEIMEKGYSSSFHEWTGELGKTYGVYEGHFPILVTSDLDLIQEIFIKKFNYFSPRKMSPHIWSDNAPFMELFHSGGEKWKRMRTIMNPTFTSNKIKTLVPLMEKCGDRFINAIEETSNHNIKVSDFFDRLTMDTIFNCAFGIDIDPQKDPSNIFMTEGLRYFKQVEPHRFHVMIRLLFPELKPLIIWGLILISYTIGHFNRKWKTALVNLYTKISVVLERRLNGKISKRDYAQILIDSCKQGTNKPLTTLTRQISESDFVDYNKMRIEKTLSENEIITNLVLFLLTGFETTSSALSYCIYEMTQRPSEMQKLQAEVDAFFPSDCDFEPNMEKINNMNYLDMFFKEVLRMHPVANGAITRRCVEPITINNINFARHLVITIDVLSLHYSEEYWDKPHEFNPLRFAPENAINPLVYMPFGVGPRTCIGMRFAQLEVKLMMIKLLRKYDVLATSDTPLKMEYSEGIVRRPKNGVSAVFKPRTFAAH